MAKQQTYEKARESQRQRLNVEKRWRDFEVAEGAREEYLESEEGAQECLGSLGAAEQAFWETLLDFPPLPPKRGWPDNCQPDVVLREAAQEAAEEAARAAARSKGKGDFRIGAGRTKQVKPAPWGKIYEWTARRMEDGVAGEVKAADAAKYFGKVHGPAAFGYLQWARENKTEYYKQMHKRFQRHEEKQEQKGEGGDVVKLVDLCKRVAEVAEGALVEAADEVVREEVEAQDRP